MKYFGSNFKYKCKTILKSAQYILTVKRRSTFLIFVITVAVNFFQHSRAMDAENTLKSGYENTRELIQKSQTTMLNALSDAEQIAYQDPNQAMDILRQALPSSLMSIYFAADIFFQTFGEALALLNKNNVKSILITGSKEVQKIGIRAMEAIESTSSLIEKGIGLDDELTKQSLKTIREIVNAAIQAINIVLDISSTYAYKALNKEQGEGFNTLNEDVSLNFLNSVYVDKINEAFNNSVSQGVSSDVVKNLKNTFLQTMDQITKYSSEEKEILQNNTDNFAVKVRALKDAIHETLANQYFIIGKTRILAGNIPREKFKPAMLTIEEGFVDFLKGLQQAESLALYGVEYDVNDSKLGVNAALEIVEYSKMAFLNAIMKAAEIAFNEIK